MLKLHAVELILVVPVVVECLCAMKYSPADREVTHGIANIRLDWKNSTRFDALLVVLNEEVPPVVFVTQDAESD